MGEMSVMSLDGDTKHLWDVGDPTSVEAASSVFNEYSGRGYQAFSMSGNGTAGAQMNGFDASAGSILFVPPMVGG